MFHVSCFISFHVHVYAHLMSHLPFLSRLYLPMLCYGAAVSGSFAPFYHFGLGLSPSFLRGSVTLLVCVRVGGERIYPCLMSTPFTCHVSTPGYPLLFHFLFSTGFRPHRFCMSVLVLVLRRINLYDHVLNFSTIYLKFNPHESSQSTYRRSANLTCELQLLSEPSHSGNFYCSFSISQLKFLFCVSIPVKAITIAGYPSSTPFLI
jgi:hypothetical protein